MCLRKIALALESLRTKEWAGILYVKKAGQKILGEEHNLYEGMKTGEKMDCSNWQKPSTVGEATVKRSLAISNWGFYYKEELEPKREKDMITFSFYKGHSAQWEKWCGGRQWILVSPLGGDLYNLCEAW